MPFAIFDIGSKLLILGFTFKVLQVTNRFTGIKNKEAGKKLLTIGIFFIAVRALIIPIVLGMPDNERNTMITVAVSIAALGMYAVLQYLLNPHYEEVLGRIAVGVTALGLLLMIIYKLRNA